MRHGRCDWRGRGEADTAPIGGAALPYENRSDLPDSVRDNLPAHAQDIYKEAYNSAWDQYGHDESRAHRVAWGAVEKKYHKNESGKWVEGASKND
jgi:cation transport regulator